MWRNPAARFVQMKIVNREPIYDDAVARGYVSQGMSDVDALGQPVTERFTDLVDPILEHHGRSRPTRCVVRSSTRSGRAKPVTRRASCFSTSPSTCSPNPSIHPSVRGAVIELLATLDLNQDTRNADGSVRLQIEDHDGLSTRHTIVLRADGTLLSREIMPSKRTPNSVCRQGQPPQLPTAAGPGSQTSNRKPARNPPGPIG